MRIKYAYNQGDIVAYEVDGKRFIGKIVGVALGEQPVIGHMYIIELTEGLQQFVAERYDYPFSCMVVPETVLKRDKE